MGSATIGRSKTRCLRISNGTNQEKNQMYRLHTSVWLILPPMIQLVTPLIRCVVPGISAFFPSSVDIAICQWMRVPP